MNVSYAPLKAAGFNWKLTQEESELIQEATEVVQYVIAKKQEEEDKNKGKGKFFKMKSIISAFSWAAQNISSFLVYLGTIAMIVFLGNRINVTLLVVMCWPERKKKVPMVEKAQEEEEETEKKKKKKHK